MTIFVFIPIPTIEKSFSLERETYEINKRTHGISLIIVSIEGFTLSFFYPYINVLLSNALLV